LAAIEPDVRERTVIKGMQLRRERALGAMAQDETTWPLLSRTGDDLARRY
jgi:hypothetical protein